MIYRIHHFYRTHIKIKYKSNIKKKYRVTTKTDPTWTEKFLQEHPNYKYDKPSRIMYLVKEAGDGDVLLKIACELFVS